MGSATFRVIVNPFNFDSSNGFNPLALAFMSGNKFDIKNLLIMSTMNGGGLFNNAGKGFNPMMLMALADNNSSDFMTMMMMNQLMGGGNMFGAANKPATETPEPSELDKINAKVDALTDNVNALVGALASNIKTQTKEEV